MKQELIEMGFEETKVIEALSMFQTKEEAADYLAKEGEAGQNQQGQSDGFEDEDQDYKMIFVVRMDLKLMLGKMAELVATACLQAYQQVEKASKTS